MASIRPGSAGGVGWLVAKDADLVCDRAIRLVGHDLVLDVAARTVVMDAADRDLLRADGCRGSPFGP